MSDRYLKALKQRHSILDAKISQLSRRPAAAASVARLKRLRLAIKDQIEQVRRAPEQVTQR